ncbi:FAD/NAD(P)-binding domain-containing protein [Phaeosphaeriaceae sp. SRC1lsM3a]|nr:FAD/NAD(P)-binding domain-containing protein [Stagonospora sp. SRC1lsM3a]
MDSHANEKASTANVFDVLVVGGGISGINAAYRVSTLLPNSSFAILEARHEIGGTWSQFNYPGVRSDSDLHTFGFSFNPWKSSNTIAKGESIMAYLKSTVRKFDLAKYFRFGQKVVAADWREEEQRWRVEVDVTKNGETKREVYWTRWLICGTGYYSYSNPHDAKIPGLEDFQGRVAHPQFWPKDLEYKGKKIVVIGSGATAITLMPALIDEGAEKVTQLQRSPSYIMSVPQKKPEDMNWFQRMIPEWMWLRWKRFIHTLMPVILYQFCIRYPTYASTFLRSKAKKELPEDFPVDPHMKPGYNPWQQRVCYCPDGDYFKCFESGRANIVTDTIKRVTKTGIELDSGDKLDADIIVTATGLRMQLFGAMTVSINGKPLDLPSHYLWRFSMLSGVPNFGNIMGYWNQSWTLGSDISIRLFTRIIQRMNENGYTSARPEMNETDAQRPDAAASPLSSTYIKNATVWFPKCKDGGAWTPRPNYFIDRWRVDRCDLNDGMKFSTVST